MPASQAGCGSQRVVGIMALLRCVASEKAVLTRPPRLGLAGAVSATRMHATVACTPEPSMASQDQTADQEIHAGTGHTGGVQDNQQQEQQGSRWQEWRLESFTFQTGFEGKVVGSDACRRTVVYADTCQRRARANPDPVQRDQREPCGVGARVRGRCKVSAQPA